MENTLKTMKKQILMMLLAGLALLAVSCTKTENEDTIPIVNNPTIITPADTVLKEENLYGKWKIFNTMPQGYYIFEQNGVITRQFIDVKKGTYSLTERNLKIFVDSTFYNFPTDLNLKECYISNDTLYGKNSPNNFYTKICYK